MSRLTRLGEKIGLRAPESDDGGLSAQHVGPAVRGLVGAMAILSAVLGILGIFEGEWPLARIGITTALGLGLLAVLGVRKEIDPAASERFRELADPSRPLPPDKE